LFRVHVRYQTYNIYIHIYVYIMRRNDIIVTIVSLCLHFCRDCILTTFFFSRDQTKQIKNQEKSLSFTKPFNNYCRIILSPSPWLQQKINTFFQHTYTGARTPAAAQYRLSHWRVFPFGYFRMRSKIISVICEWACTDVCVCARAYIYTRNGV
jgi:hypothetical protein